jgi:hypothetical protein
MGPIASRKNNRQAINSASDAAGKFGSNEGGLSQIFVTLADRGSRARLPVVGLSPGISPASAKIHFRREL